MPRWRRRGRPSAASPAAAATSRCCSAPCCATRASRRGPGPASPATSFPPSPSTTGSASTGGGTRTALRAAPAGGGPWRTRSWTACTGEPTGSPSTPTTSRATPSWSPARRGGATARAKPTPGRSAWRPTRRCGADPTSRASWCGTSPASTRWSCCAGTCGAWRTPPRRRRDAAGLALLDRLAALTRSGDGGFGEVQRLYEAEPRLRVPAVITSLAAAAAAHAVRGHAVDGVATDPHGAGRLEDRGAGAAAAAESPRRPRRTGNPAQLDGICPRTTSRRP